MGLAAAQARLLTITARKADCEFQSMTLSHQKIALARDMERISDEYQNALNVTKLIYDATGLGNSNITLSYGLLMNPSAYNDYYPKLVTNPQNRVVLNTALSAAARAAGIPVEGLSGTPSSLVRDTFIEALATYGVITPLKAAEIQATKYNNGVALGSTNGVTYNYEEITYDQLVDEIKNATESTNTFGVANLSRDCTVGWMKDHGFSFWAANNDNIMRDKSEIRDINKNLDWSCAQTTVKKYVNGVPQANFDDPFNNNTGNGLSLADLLDPNSNITLEATTNGGLGVPALPLAQLQETIAGYKYEANGQQNDTTGKSVLNWMLQQFKLVLGGVSNEQDAALMTAYKTLQDNIFYNSGGNDSLLNKLLDGNINNDGYRNKKVENKHNRINAPGIYGHHSIEYGTAAFPDKFDKKDTNDGRAQGIVYQAIWNSNNSYLTDPMKQLGIQTGSAEDSRDYLGFVFTMTSSGADDHNQRAQSNRTSEVGVSLSNIARAFLSEFINAMKGVEGEDAEYNVKKGKADELYDPKTDDYMFRIQGTAEIEQTDSLYSNFYDSLFNNICLHGWVQNGQIEDPEYLAEMLKGGMAYISTIGNDGFYYQGNYATDTCILEVTDEDAVTRAQAKYNAEKSRIDHKEDTIDLKMKNLDTEITALGTEYDSVKQIISKAVDKSFKRYEA